MAEIFVDIHNIFGVWVFFSTHKMLKTLMKTNKIYKVCKNFPITKSFVKDHMPMYSSCMAVFVRVVVYFILCIPLELKHCTLL